MEECSPEWSRINLGFWSEMYLGYLELGHVDSLTLLSLGFLIC